MPDKPAKKAREPRSTRRSDDSAAKYSGKAPTKKPAKAAKKTPAKKVASARRTGSGAQKKTPRRPAKRLPPAPKSGIRIRRPRGGGRRGDGGDGAASAASARTRRRDKFRADCRDRLTHRRAGCGGHRPMRNITERSGCPGWRHVLGKRCLPGSVEPIDGPACPAGHPERQNPVRPLVRRQWHPLRRDLASCARR